MSIFAGCLVYLILWWTVLFAVLPWKVKPDPKAQVGNDKGAPLQPYLKEKLLITTAIAGLLWGMVAYMISHRWISLSS